MKTPGDTSNFDDYEEVTTTIFWDYFGCFDGWICFKVLIGFATLYLLECDIMSTVFQEALRISSTEKCQKEFADF